MGDVISTPEPWVPVPFPVTVVDQVEWWEILLSVGVPVGSLAIAVLALVQGGREAKRRRDAEAQLAAKEASEDRHEYAERLKQFVRDLRDGNVDASFSDTWLDLMHDAPDEVAPTLIQWIVNEFGAQEQAFRGSPGEKADFARFSLGNDALNRVNSWAKVGEYSRSPHPARGSWPKQR